VAGVRPNLAVAARSAAAQGGDVPLRELRERLRCDPVQNENINGSRADRVRLAYPKTDRERRRELLAIHKRLTDEKA